MPNIPRKPNFEFQSHFKNILKKLFPALFREKNALSIHQRAETLTTENPKEHKMNNQSGAGTSKNIKWNVVVEAKNSAHDTDDMTDTTADSTEQINQPAFAEPIFTDIRPPHSTGTDDKKQKFMQNLDRQEPRHVCIVGSCNSMHNKPNPPKTKENNNIVDELTDNAANLATFVTYVCQHDCGTNVTTQLTGDVHNPQKTILSESHGNCDGVDGLSACYSTNSDATSIHTANTPSAPPPYSAACTDHGQNNLPRYNEAPFNCGGQIDLLMETQKDLKMRIDRMEERQKVGAALLQQADLMWSNMEKEYKQKITASKKRQVEMNSQLKEVQESVNKWRRNFTDLDSQKSVLLKCRLDIKEKKMQRKNDIKFLGAEINDLQKRKEQIQKDIEGLEEQMEPKKKHGEEEIQKMNISIKELEDFKESEIKKREEKEKEGIEALTIARNELTNLTKELMQKKMENQSLEATKIDLSDELTQLKTSISTCKVTCSSKEKQIKQEIEQVEAEIANVKTKTLKCTKCVDTKDMQSFCSDCPMCLAANECDVKDGCCSNAGGGDNCICTDVKLRFTENVLENMYSVLVKHFNTKAGKDVIEAINQCMQNNTYGKLTKETREILKDFIMQSLKKDMGMTLVAGAAKTRCEMDAATYSRLMQCLNQVKVSAPLKLNEETLTIKPCEFWSGCNDCNCPKGPKECICVTKLGKSPFRGCGIDCKSARKISPTNSCRRGSPKHRNANCGTDGNVSSSNCNKYYTNTKAAQCLIEVDHQTFKSTQLAKTSSHCACTNDLNKDSVEIYPSKSISCNCAWKSETTDCHGNMANYRNDKANDPFVWKTKKTDVVTYRDIVKVVVHGRNKAAVEIFADVIMTSSGNMALEINESVLVTTQMSDLKVVHLSLQTTPYGDYYIDISSACTFNNKLKSSLLKTSAGTALIFIPASMIDTIRGNEVKGDLSSSPSKELSKANSIIGSINEIEKSKSQIRSNLYLKHNEQLLAVLRKSGSHTFDVVLDKEHEGEHSKKLSLLFSADKKYNIVLKENKSSISILAENSEEKVGNHVVRSPSGKLKLICSSTTEILNGVETCALTYCDVPTNINDRLPYPDDLKSLIDLSKPKIIKHSSIIEEIGIPNPLFIAPFSAKGTQMSYHDDEDVKIHTDDVNQILDLFVYNNAFAGDKKRTTVGSKNNLNGKCYCNRIQDCCHLTTIRRDSLKRSSCHGKKKAGKFNKITRNSNASFKPKPELNTVIQDILPIKYFDML